MRRLLPLAVLFLVIAGVVLIVRQHSSRAVIGTVAANCFGDLNATTYPSGFHASDFSLVTAAYINTGSELQLDTNLAPLDPQHIVLPFDQDVKVKYVYRNAGASHSIGWFYFDQVAPFLDKAATDPTAKLADRDNDGVPDFFQTKKTSAGRNYDGLFTISGTNTVPDLFNSSLGWSDGGTYPHIPNLLETYFTTAGGLIFKIADDDTDTSVGGNWSSASNGAPVSDSSTTNDGVPDYDVNGSGSIDVNDRTVDLGLIQGGREIVFFAMTYWSMQLKDIGIGLPGATQPLQVLSAPAESGGNASGNVLEFTPTAQSGSGDRYLYWQFANTTYKFTTNNTSGKRDCLDYDVFLDAGSCSAGLGGIDIHATDGSTLRASGWKDYTDGTSGNTTANITSKACNQWYHRHLALPSGWQGKTADRWDLAAEPDVNNTSYTVYYDNIKVVQCNAPGTVKVELWSSGQPSANALDSTNGYGVGPKYYDAQTVPWFTKNLLNPDYQAQPSGTQVQKIAIGCSRDDSSCYNPLGATIGWLDSAAISRLNTTAYNNLVLDKTVTTISADGNGTVPHFVVNAPQSDPNRWLIAFDDQPQYPGASDFDYNDVVFLVDRVNGGSIQSNLINSDIPSTELPNTVISKIKVTLDARYPSPGCDGVSGAEVRVYYSVDNKKTWNQVVFPNRSGGTITIDVLGAGQVGNQLYWRADFVSPSQTCQPVIHGINVGYEAVEHGEFKFGSPIPQANMVYTGSLETPPFESGEPAATRNDFSARGHFYATRLYDPADPSVTSLVEEWDAGAVLSSANASPNNRNIYTSVDGTTRAFTVSNLSTLAQQVLPNAVRSALSNGKPVYDFSGDNTADDNDAKFIIDWTRGWEYSSNVTMTPAVSAQMRGWRLGPVHNSSPAIVGPVPRPAWLDGAGAPAAMVTASNSFRAANATRGTRAIVGAQDGMLHAFNAGQYRYGADSSCAVNLQRGCFAGSDDATRYGDGAEVWAWIPPSQLGSLKNNHPQVKDYNPTANPPAEVDGSVAVEDIYSPSTNTFKTIAYASLGRRQPYVTAVDITGATPQAVWANDFTDVDYNGTELPPSVALTAVASGKFLTVTTSGLASTAKNEYLYLIDALTGALISGGKVQLNTGSDSATAYGFASYANLVDANGDGLVDRIYVVDTSGRIFKHDLVSNQHCMVASMGETVYSGMAVTVGGTAAAPVVQLYLGGAPNPDGTGSCSSNSDCSSGQTCSNNVCTTSPPVLYHLKAFKDSDVVGSCTRGGAQTIYTATLPAGQKLWASPYVNADTAFYATAGTASASVCLTANGSLYALSTQGDGGGDPVGGVPSSPPVLSGTPVSSLSIYDGHALINTVGGKTTVAGGSGWNNAATGSTSTGGAIQSLPTLIWQEL